MCCCFKIQIDVKRRGPSRSGHFIHTPLTMAPKETLPFFTFSVQLFYLFVFTVIFKHRQEVLRLSSCSLTWAHNKYIVLKSFILHVRIVNDIKLS
jgi:hypothetical protein